MKRAEDLECIVMTVGEPTIDHCLRSIDKQVLQPARLVRVDNVSPISESINRRHAAMRLPYSIKVDADMVLHKNCFLTLYEKVKEVPEHYYAVTGMLDDPFIGVMGAIHIEKTELVRGIVVENTIGCDRYVRKVMADKDYHIFELDDILGEHWCDWSEEAVFKRHMRVGQKLAHFKNKHYEDWIQEIGYRWMEWGRDTPFLALLGLCYGLLTPDGKEKGVGFADEEWQRTKELINHQVIPKADYLYSYRKR